MTAIDILRAEGEATVGDLRLRAQLESSLGNPDEWRVEVSDGDRILKMPSTSTSLDEATLDALKAWRDPHAYFILPGGRR